MAFRKVKLFMINCAKEWSKRTLLQIWAKRELIQRKVTKDDLNYKRSVVQGKSDQDFHIALTQNGQGQTH
jgi:hypothetical protein